MDLTGIMNADEVDPNGRPNKEEVKAVETKTETPTGAARKVRRVINGAVITGCITLF